jgi:hypothetical protein
LAWVLLFVPAVRLALSSIDTQFGEAEAQRQAEIRAYRQKAAKAKNREQVKDRIFGSLKRGFSLLIMMTVISFAFTHQEEIQKFIFSKVTRLAAPSNNSALRQSALNHQNEVDQIAQ